MPSLRNRQRKPNSKPVGLLFGVVFFKRLCFRLITQYAARTVASANATSPPAATPVQAPIERSGREVCFSEPATVFDEVGTDGTMAKAEELSVLGIAIEAGSVMRRVRTVRAGVDSCSDLLRKS